MNKYKHYEIRVDRNTGIPFKLEDLPKDFIQLSFIEAVFHNQRKKKGHLNRKFVGPVDSYDGSQEAVYDTNRDLVTNSLNGGTYNFKSPTHQSFWIRTIGHFIYDILPYYFWGNAYDDPTSFFDRLFLVYQGNIPHNNSLSRKRKIEKLLKKMEEKQKKRELYIPKLVISKVQYIANKYRRSDRPAIKLTILQLGDKKIIELRHKAIYTLLGDKGFYKEAS